MNLKRGLYRIWQFWKAINSTSLTFAEKSDLTAVLNEDQLALFFRQDDASQRHAYRVFQLIHEAGYENQELLQAALLHDIGKSKVNIYWWDRPLVVIAKSVFPEKTEIWGRGDLQSWRRPFAVKERHAVWGAEMAEMAKCSPLTVQLIRRHEDHFINREPEEAERLLAILIWADDQS